jgi:hypothetical protein
VRGLTLSNSERAHCAALNTRRRHTAQALDASVRSLNTAILNTATIAATLTPPRRNPRGPLRRRGLRRSRAEPLGPARHAGEGGGCLSTMEQRIHPLVHAACGATDAPCAHRSRKHISVCAWSPRTRPCKPQRQLYSAGAVDRQSDLSIFEMKRVASCDAQCVIAHCCSILVMKPDTPAQPSLCHGTLLR